MSSTSLMRRQWRHRQPFLPSLMPGMINLGFGAITDTTAAALFADLRFARSSSAHTGSLARLRRVYSRRQALMRSRFSSM